MPRLKALGLISEIISWKLRLFIPTGAEGTAILAVLLDRHALVGVTDRIGLGIRGGDHDRLGLRAGTPPRP